MSKYLVDVNGYDDSLKALDYLLEKELVSAIIVTSLDQHPDSVLFKIKGLYNYHHEPIFIGAYNPITSDNLIDSVIRVNFDDIYDHIYMNKGIDYLILGSYTTLSILLLAYNDLNERINEFIYLAKGIKDNNIINDIYATKLVFSYHQKRLLIINDDYLKGFDLINNHDYIIEDANVDVDDNGNYTKGYLVIDIRQGWAKDKRKDKLKTKLIMNL